MLERYIVVATDKLRRGVLYVGDLRTDASKRNSSVDPPAQTRYLTPPDADLISIDSASGRVMRTARGIGAYFAARVAPGGAAPLAATVMVVGVAVGDTLSIGGVKLTAEKVENASKGQFLSSADAGSDALSAASLTTVLNDPLVQGALKGAVGAPVTVSAAGNVVTLSIPAGTKAPLVTPSDKAHLVVSAFTAPAAKLPGPYAYDQAAQDILARVRAGLSMKLADINAILKARLDGSLTAGGSAGSLAEFLGLLAGRTFELAGGTQVFSGMAWVGGPGVGSFTRPRKTYDAHMVHGMLVPKVPGGDENPIEIGPARRTFPGSYFSASQINGQLARLTKAVLVRGAAVPERVAVVYTEDGSVA